MSDDVKETPIGVQIREAKELDDSISLLNKEINEAIEQLPQSMEKSAKTMELNRLKDKLERYLKENEIDSMKGEGGYGKISLNEKTLPGTPQWDRLYRDIIKDVLVSSNVKALSIEEGGRQSIEDFIKGIDLGVLLNVFGILNKKINSNTFNTWVKTGNVPEYIPVYEEVKLSLTKS